MGNNNKLPGCMKVVGLKKGPWSPEEDQKLLDYIHNHGLGSWRALPEKAGLRRCGKSCRLRWRNYLRPDIKRGEFSLQEEQTIIQLHALLGNRWSIIANQLPRRTDNEIKNHWNTHLKKRLTKMGIDPVTHKRSNQSKESSIISHIAQWETARLEAEGRLASNPSPPPPFRPQQQRAYPYAWTWTSTINPNNDDFHNTTSDPLMIFAGSSSSDNIDGIGAIPEMNLLYSSCFGSNYSTVGDGNVAGSYNLEFPGDFISSSSYSWTSNFAEQQLIEGSACDDLNCPNGIMY